MFEDKLCVWIFYRQMKHKLKINSLTAWGKNGVKR